MTGYSFLAFLWTETKKSFSRQGYIIKDISRDTKVYSTACEPRVTGDHMLVVL